MYYFENENDREFIISTFIKKPCSLMHSEKTDRIIESIKKFNCQNILEIGTFAGGTAYLLKKNLNDRSVTTIDINRFDQFFNMYDHRKILKSLKNGYPEIHIDKNSILKIQKIYKDLEPEITFLEGTINDVDIEKYDFFIVDDDHRADVLYSNLESIYQKMEKGIIVVDDCVHEHIKNTCISFCEKNNIQEKDYYFDTFMDYGTIKGYDLFFIIKNL
jgi:hypothetical protein